jgi:hypothetical protein
LPPINFSRDSSKTLRASVHRRLSTADTCWIIPAIPPRIDSTRFNTATRISQRPAAPVGTLIERTSGHDRPIRIRHLFPRSHSWFSGAASAFLLRRHQHENSSPKHFSYLSDRFYCEICSPQATQVLVATILVDPSALK